jgi:hypothetical protein
MIATVEMVNPHQIAVHFQHVGYAGGRIVAGEMSGVATPCALSLAAKYAGHWSVFILCIF